MSNFRGSLQYFGRETRLAVAEFQRAHGTEPTGDVDKKTNEMLNQEIERIRREKTHIVKGTVLHPNGQPLVDGIVKAFDKDLRSEQSLGESATDPKGRYEITYRIDQFPRAEKKRTDLIVRVYDQKNNLLYEPQSEEIVFNAPSVALIDVQLEVGGVRVESEYEKMVKDIGPLLESVPVAKLGENDKHRDITFLYKGTGWPVEQLQHLVLAHRLQSLSKIQTDFFYALLRENVFLRLSISLTESTHIEITLQTKIQPLLYDIVLLEPEVIRNAITRAIETHIIPARVQDKLDGIIEKLRRWRKEAQTYFKNEQPKKILNLIEKYLVAGKHEEVLKVLRKNYWGDLPRLFDELRKVAVFRSGEDAGEAETKLHLADLFGFNEQIIERVAKLENIKTTEDLRKLALLNKSGWKQSLTKSMKKIRIGGALLKAKLIDKHASVLVRKMEARFPTTAFAAQLGRDQKSVVRHHETIARVVSEHPEIDLRTTNIDEYFRKRKLTVGRDEDPEDVKAELKTVQRVFRLTPNYGKTKVLLKEGINSAQSIIAMGESQFVRRCAKNRALTKKEAKAVYRKAVDTHTAAMLVVGELGRYTQNDI